MKQNISWAAVSASVAIIGLTISLVFSIISVNQTTRATELQVLTQAHQMVNNSTCSFNTRHGEELELYITDERAYLSTEARYQIHQVLNDIEYMAWIYNSGYVRKVGGEELWFEGLVHSIDYYSQAIMKLYGDQGPAYFEDAWPECQRLSDMTQR